MISMKHIGQHVAQKRVVWANKIIVTTVKFYGRYNDLIYPYMYNLSLGHMLCDMFHTNH
jgi:hypothetical protein